MNLELPFMNSFANIEGMPAMMSALKEKLINGLVD
jgi:hypothetical protein